MGTYRTILTRGALLAMTLVVSCADPGTSPLGPRSLVTPEAWTLVEHTEDPWAHEDGTPSDCPDATFYLEEGVLEIDTNQCAHITLTQPSLTPVNAGESIRVSLYHQNLWSPTAFEQEEQARVAARIGEFELFSEHIPIPQAAKPISHTWVTPRSLPAGTPVHVHISNHGTNTWYVYDLAVEDGAGHGASPD